MSDANADDNIPCFPEDKVNIFNTFISRLQSLKTGINNINENNKTFLGTIKDRINSLIDKIKEINKRISNINTEINGYKNEINNLKKDKDDCIKKLEELTNKQLEYTSKIEELEIQADKNKNIINEIEKMRKKNERCKEESEKLMNQIDSINAEILENTTYVETLDKSSKEIGDELKLATDNLEAEVNSITNNNNNDTNSVQMQLQSQPIPIINPNNQQSFSSQQPFTEFTIPGSSSPTSYNDIINDLTRKSLQLSNDPNNKYAIALRKLNNPNMSQNDINNALVGTYKNGKITGGKQKKYKTKKITRKRMRRKTQKGGFIALYKNKKRRTSSARSSKRSLYSQK